MSYWSALRKRGVMGINERNIAFTQGENPRHLYPLVDNKLLSKSLCARAGIPVPPVVAVAKRHGDVHGLIEELKGVGDFVLKPAMGAMGNGILVIHEPQAEGWRTAGGRIVSANELAYHAESIISGLYTLGGRQDVVLVEERLRVHRDFERISHKGVPDIRIIVFRGVPVMAMTRLPTRRSAGRANLHQGAVGAGIDLATGETTYAIIGSHPIEIHPDTLERVPGFEIPHFSDALRAAICATDETGLGYVGADVVIDARYGPVILEMNARPGLAIQLANRAGLGPRLTRIRELNSRDHTLEERIAIGLELADTC